MLTTSIGLSAIVVQIESHWTCLSAVWLWRGQNTAETAQFGKSGTHECSQASRRSSWPKQWGTGCTAARTGPPVLH